MIEIAIGADVAGRALLGTAEIDRLEVRERDVALDAEVDALCAALRAAHGQRPSSEVPGVAEARALYKSLGIDPTKTRPSCEALLRRALKGEPLYRVNTLVDALNLVSLREQLSFGLYDRQQLQPPVVLRKGRVGEGYEGIRKGSVNMEGRPVLADAEGPFGNPTSDSLRTSITTATRDALVVAFAPASFGADRLAGVMTRTVETLTRFCGGNGTGVGIVQGSSGAGSSGALTRDEPLA